MGVSVLSGPDREEARAKARNLHDGRWATVARRVEDRTDRLKRLSRQAYGLGLAAVLVVAWGWGETVAAYVDEGLPFTPGLLVLVTGAAVVLLVRLVERLLVRDRVIALLWDALVLTCVTSASYRVEAEVAGRLAYAARLARTRLGTSAGFSAFGRAAGPRCKAAALGERLRHLAEWPFRYAGRASRGPDWRADLQAELPLWIMALDDGTWYRRIPDGATRHGEDLPDVQMAGLAVLGMLGLGAFVLAGEHLVDGLAAVVLATALVLVLVGRPLACAAEAAVVALRAELPRLVRGGGS